MDKFQSWELGGDADDLCDQCGMLTSDKGSCCRDEIRLVKLQNDVFQSGAIIQALVLCPSTVTVYFSFIEFPRLNSLFNIAHDAHSPPLLSKQNTYLDICVFRI